ncbi:hypothetical protein MKW92_006495 [Papaver armeniacum]|nr:hypothetical protein MKW92_006495 [Papaver armeniacum]
MELSLSGNSLKTLARSITCLARVGNELSIQASPSQLAFHTLNTSRSAYQSITLKPRFFDVYTISEPQVQCSVLLKAVCAVLRTPVASIDRLCVLLPKSDASKLQWTIDCTNGMKKSYWITCNVEPDIQHLPSIGTSFPRDYCDCHRTNSLPSDDERKGGGKAVELRSYIDPTKDDSDTALHTQLWIDPSEEFLQYTHTGDPVDAFLTFCEGCEVDIHIFFKKATSDFDVTLVLTSMLVSQLHPQNPPECPPAADPETCGQADQGTGSIAQQEGQELLFLSNHQIIPESGQNFRSVIHMLMEGLMERVTAMGISNRTSAKEGTLAGRDVYSNHLPVETANVQAPQGINWVGPDEDDDEDENDMFVQSTPPY